MSVESLIGEGVAEFARYRVGVTQHSVGCEVLRVMEAAGYEVVQRAADPTHVEGRDTAWWDGAKSTPGVMAMVDCGRVLYAVGDHEKPLNEVELRDLVRRALGAIAWGRAQAAAREEVGS